MANIRLGRRDILRGLGAGAALLGPFARSVDAWAAPTGGNLAVFYTPNGFVRKDYHFSGALAGAAAYQSKMTIVQNMKCSAASSKQSHEDIVKILTCVPGGNLYSAQGPSVEWVVAEHYKQQPLVLAALGNKGPNWNTKLSWKASGSFAPHTNSPAEAFKQAFPAGAPMANPTPTTPSPGGLSPEKALLRQKGVLDFVMDDIKTLQSRLAAPERAKLDAHLSVVRDLEVKLQGTTGGAVPVSPGGSCSPKAPAGGADMKADIEAHMDVMAASFACGVKRAASLLCQPSSSGVSPVGGGNHHNITHAHNYGTWAAIDKWYGERLGYFLKKLESVGVLDRTIVVWCSEIEEEHDLRSMKWSIAGGSALGLKHSGATLSVADVGNVWVTVRQALGVPGDKHGAVSGGIPGLT